MNTVVNNFVQRFHNLEGLSFDERRRNFFGLLQENTVNDRKNLDSIISRLEPKTHLERILFIELLVYYRCFGNLYVEFMKGNEIVVSKLSREKWFFKQAFQNVGYNFVQDVLPTVSYRIRLKILNKIKDIVSEDRCNQLFDALFERYGVFMATNVLVGCNEEKIINTLENYPIQLRTNQLKLLYKKNPNLIYVYLKERVKLMGGSNCLEGDVLFSFIAQENPEMFCNLQEKYQIKNCKIGKRTTKKLVQSQKEKIIAKPLLYVANLHKMRLVRTLGQDFQKLYFNLYPRQMSKLHDDSTEHLKLLKHYPKKHQFQLFKSTFDNIFEEKLETKSNLIALHVLEMVLYSDEDRDKWVNIRCQHEDTDDNLSYLTVDKCIAAIADRNDVAIRFAKRETSLIIMVLSCIKNKDWKSLLQVLIFLVKKLEHDDSTIFIHFIKLIERNPNNVLDNLNVNHWSLIIDILSMRILKIHKYCDINIILYKYFQFLSKTRSDFEKVFLAFTADFSWSQDFCIFTSPYLPEKNIKLYLLFLIKNGEELCIDHRLQANIKLIVWCFEHNKHYKNDTINVWAYPTLIKSLKTVLSNPELIFDNYIVALATKYLICTFDKSATIERLSNKYWNNFDKLGSIFVTNWFLKHALGKIPSTDRFFQTLIKFGSADDPHHHDKRVKKIFYTIKNYSHLSLYQKFIEYSMSKLKDDAFSNKFGLAYTLSMLMPQEKFLNLLDSYEPARTKANLQGSLEKAQNLVRQSLLKCLINTKQPKQTCSIILKIINSENFRFCLRSLYSCLYQIPERNLQPILSKICSKKDVLIKKHAYHFACIALDQNALTSALQSCLLNQSIAMTYKHFVKNPSEASWTLFTTKLSKIKKDNDYTIRVLISRPTPKNYQSRYVALPGLKNLSESFANNLYYSLRDDTIGELSQDFLLSIEDDFYDNAVVVFAKYLVFSPDTNKCQFIANILSRLKENHSSLQVPSAQVKLAHFVQILFKSYMDAENTNNDWVILFSKYFEHIFYYFGVFEEFLIIYLMRFKNCTLSNFCREIASFSNQLLPLFGERSIPVLANVLNKHLPFFGYTEVLMYNFYFLLINEERTIINLLLVAHSLPKTKPELIESVKFHNDIIEILENVQDERIRSLLI